VVLKGAEMVRLLGILIESPHTISVLDPAMKGWYVWST